MAVTVAALGGLSAFAWKVDTLRKPATMVQNVAGFGRIAFHLSTALSGWHQIVVLIDTAQQAIFRFHPIYYKVDEAFQRAQFEPPTYLLSWVRCAAKREIVRPGGPRDQSGRKLRFRGVGYPKRPASESDTRLHRGRRVSE